MSNTCGKAMPLALDNVLSSQECIGQCEVQIVSLLYDVVSPAICGKTSGLIERLPNEIST